MYRLLNSPNKQKGEIFTQSEFTPKRGAQTALPHKKCLNFIALTTFLIPFLLDTLFKKKTKTTKKAKAETSSGTFKVGSCHFSPLQEKKINFVLGFLNKQTTTRQTHI